MRIVVQKYGGTSLNTTKLRSRVCDIIEQTKTEQIKVVVIVSAMGRKENPYATDTFIKLAKEVNPQPSPRELDIIMSCGEIISGIVLSSQLAARGTPAKFLSGAQSGLVTDGVYGDARVLYVNPDAIWECLKNDIVPVVAGFQGVSENGEITTLGRGGSDTTASALGAALDAEIIEIFTDVEGVMTADPRIVSDARLLDALSYNEVCQLARDGARVVHPRAVEIAMQKGIPLRVRSTLTGSMGTLVTNGIRGKQQGITIINERLITGITYTSDIAQIRIETRGLENRKGLEYKVFQSLAKAGISVDFINMQPDTILFTVAEDWAGRTVKILQAIGIHVRTEMQCAKVAVVGAAMTGMPGVMSRVVEALTDKDIPILQSGDSYTNIWCLIKKEYMEIAVKALHDKFELGIK